MVPNFGVPKTFIRTFGASYSIFAIVGSLQGLPTIGNHPSSGHKMRQATDAFTCFSENVKPHLVR